MVAELSGRAKALDAELPSFTIFLGTVVMKMRRVAPDDVRVGKRVRLTEHFFTPVLNEVWERSSEITNGVRPDKDAVRRMVRAYVGTEWRYEA
jgi:hypothetical protein